MSVRGVLFLLAFIATSMALPLPANAQQQVAIVNPAVGAQSSQVENPTRPQSDLLLEVLRQITESKATRNLSAQQIYRLDQLGTLYSHPDAKTYWTSENDVHANVASLRKAFSQANYWGLDSSAFTVPESPVDGIQDLKKLANFEIETTLATLKYAEHAKGGRIDPRQLSLWLTLGPRRIDVLELIPRVANSSNPTGVLEDLHPKHPQFLALLKAYRAKFFPSTAVVKKEEEIIIIPRGRRIRPGKSHPHIALVRRRLKVPSTAQGENFYDDNLADAVARYMKSRGWKNRRVVVDKWVRRKLNEEPLRKSKRKNRGHSIRKFVINLDRWRRMPENLGDMHFLNNLPSYKTRLFKNGEIIHEERIIIGKPSTQTPIFSGKMNHVVFKPNWGVPTSIKIRQLLPRLRGGDYGVLRRRGMKIVGKNNRAVNPRRFNWRRTNIADIAVVQGPGSSNPLGQVKFMFPNRHAVYMHDTPKKWLFKNTKRAFSAGCIRVRNPKRLAEIIMHETHKWEKAAVHANFNRKAAGNNRVDLSENIPVHNTYFTLYVNEQGELISYADVYGHDKRIGRAMDGVSAKRIARSDPARRQKEQLKQITKNSNYALYNADGERRTIRFQNRLLTLAEYEAELKKLQKKNAYYQYGNQWGYGQKPKKKYYKKYKYRNYVPMHRRQRTSFGW